MMEKYHVMFSVSKEVEEEFWERFKVEEMVWEDYYNHPHIIARGLEASFDLSEVFLKKARAEWNNDVVFDLGVVFYEDFPSSSINVVRNILRQLPKNSWIFLALANEKLFIFTILYF